MLTQLPSLARTLSESEITEQLVPLLNVDVSANKAVPTDHHAHERDIWRIHGKPQDQYERCFPYSSTSHETLLGWWNDAENNFATGGSTGARELERELEESFRLAESRCVYLRDLIVRQLLWIPEDVLFEHVRRHLDDWEQISLSLPALALGQVAPLSATSGLRILDETTVASAKKSFLAHIQRLISDALNHAGGSIKLNVDQLEQIAWLARQLSNSSSYRVVEEISSAVDHVMRGRQGWVRRISALLDRLYICDSVENGATADDLRIEPRVSRTFAQVV